MSRSADSSLKQLTVRGFGDELADRLVELARTQGISLNEAVLRLLRRSAGLGRPGDRADRVGTSLDHLAGTWSAQELREFRDAIGPLERVDADLWPGPAGGLAGRGRRRERPGRRR